MTEHFVNDDGGYSELLAELTEELDNEENAEKAFRRCESQVITENIKRQKIQQLFQRLDNTDSVLMVLEIFMPSVKLDTIMNGMKGEMLPLPTREQFKG